MNIKPEMSDLYVLCDEAEGFGFEENTDRSEALRSDHEDNKKDEGKEERAAKFPKLPIRKKMFWAVYSLILLLTLIVDSLVFVTYKYDIESQIAQFGNQTMDESGINISRNILSKEENLTFKIEQCNLFTAEAKKNAYSENSKEMKALAALVGSSGFQVTACYLKRTNGSEEFWTNGSITISEFRDSAINGVLQSGSERLDLNRGIVIWRRMEDAPGSVYIIKNVIDDITLEKQAVLCIQIDKSFFRSLQNTENMSVLIQDEKGSVLYYSDELEPVIDEILLGQGDDFIMMNTKITKKNWSMTGVISKQQVLDTLHRLLFIMGVIEVVFCIISFWIAKYVSENMTANIAALIDSMKQLEQGSQADMIQAKTTDETAYLVEVFNNLNQKLQETIESLTVNRTQKERAEYNALIAQLNPHFLYNALESVSAMAKLSQQCEIVEAVDNLAKLLRACLSGNEAEITLDKEFDYIRQFLSLEKLITGGQIDWDIDCGEDLYCCRVPKLILQPLVENSIVHGFDTHINEAMIVILVWADEDKLVIEVSDNGVGMSQRYADEIIASEEVKKSEHDRRHIGIKSIQQRLRYLYGDKYGVQIKTQEEVGTAVRLTMPVIKE